jgi:hypothetical protein
MTYITARCRMRTFAALILTASLGICPAQVSPQRTALKLKIEAPELDRRMLLDRLNSHGSEHGMKFELSDTGFDYRIVFQTSQGSAQALAAGSGGSFNTSVATADVFDSNEKELFRFDRKNRWTDSGAANAVAKEIIKRMLKLNGSPR